MNKFIQLGMEQTILEALKRFPEPERPDQPNLYCSPIMECCREETRTVYLRYRTYPWMANRMNCVHGGVISNMIDHAMEVAALGALGYYEGILPTMSLTLNYKKPTPVDHDIMIRTSVIHLDERIAQTTAVLYAADASDHELVTASGVYYTKAALQRHT